MIDRRSGKTDRQTDKHYTTIWFTQLEREREREAQLCRFLLPLPLSYPSLPPFPLADRLSVGTAFAKVVRLAVLVELLLIDNLFSRAPLELLLVNTPQLNAKLNAFSAVRRRKGKGKRTKAKNHIEFSLCSNNRVAPELHYRRNKKHCSGYWGESVGESISNLKVESHRSGGKLCWHTVSWYKLGTIYQSHSPNRLAAVVFLHWQSSIFSIFINIFTRLLKNDPSD